MAISINFSDGSTDYIFHEEESEGYYDDFQKIIYERLGRESEQVIIKLRKAADYTAKKVNTDLTAYESELHSNTACFQDILQILLEIENMVTFSKRLNKPELQKNIQRIKTEIKNQI